MSDSGERIRVRGKAHGAGDRRVLVGEGSLKPSYGEEVKRAERRQFELVADDGRAFTVDTAGAKLFAKERKHRGAWASVREEPLAALFVDAEPGPHVEVELVGRAVVEGEPLEIEGRIDTATAPHTIRAGYMAAEGSEGELDRALAPAKPASGGEKLRGRAWRAQHGWIFALAPLPLVLFVPWAFCGVWALWFVMWGLAAVIVHRLTRGLPEFTRLSPGSIYRAESNRDAAGLITFYIFATMAAAAGVVVPSDAGPQAAFVLDIVAAVGILLCALLGWLYLRGVFREQLAVLRAVHTAPTLPAAPPDGAWGTIEGRLRARMEMSGQRKKSFSDTSTQWWWTCQGTQEFSGPLEIETSSGKIVVESSDDGLWATTERIVKRHAADARQDRIIEKIPENGGVVALGKIRRQGGAPHLVATGKESLIVFGTREGTGGREALARCLGGWRMTLLPLAAAAALALVVVCAAFLVAMRDAEAPPPAPPASYAPVLPPLPAPYAPQAPTAAPAVPAPARPPVVEAPLTR